MFNCEFHRRTHCLQKPNGLSASWVPCSLCVQSTDQAESSILTGMYSFWPYRLCFDVIRFVGNPIPLTTAAPGHLAEGHPDHPRTNHRLKLLLPLLSPLVRLGGQSNNDPARRRPRSLPHSHLLLTPDPLSLRGPSGNVSTCDLVVFLPSLTRHSLADTRYVPTPPTTEPQLLAPPRVSPGLFGPRSPRDSLQQ